MQPPFQGEVIEHPQRMFAWISSYHYNYMVEEEACLYAHFSYIWHHFLLLDEPQIPLITVEARVMYHFPFEHTPHCDINHVIHYYAYFGFEQLDNPLRLLGGLLDLPSVRTRPSRSTRMWEISTMMRISRHPRSLSTGMSMVKRYLRERWFRPTSDPSQDMTSP